MWMVPYGTVEVSENSGVGVGDFADAFDGAETVLELLADAVLGIVDYEECDNLLESERDGLDRCLLELYACGDYTRNGCDDLLEVHVSALGHDVVG